MSRVVRKHARVRPLAIPRPLVHELGRKASLQHINNVLAQDREELEAVEISAGGDVEALGGGVGRDDEVGAGGESIPGIGQYVMVGQ